MRSAGHRMITIITVRSRITTVSSHRPTQRKLPTVIVRLTSIRASWPTASRSTACDTQPANDTTFSLIPQIKEINGSSTVLKIAVHGLLCTLVEPTLIAYDDDSALHLPPGTMSSESAGDVMSTPFRTSLEGKGCPHSENPP